MSWTFQDREEPQTGGVVPEGQYPMIILDAEAKLTKRGSHNMIEIKSAPNGNGPWVYTNLSFLPEGEKGADYALALVDAFYRAIGKPEWIQCEQDFIDNVQRLKSMRFDAYLIVEDRVDYTTKQPMLDEQGRQKQRNVIKKFIPKETKPAGFFA